jgi:hypothetical protein
MFFATWVWPNHPIAHLTQGVCLITHYYLFYFFALQPKGVARFHFLFILGKKIKKAL